MPLITWSENLSVENIQMDNQHKKLVEIINSLYEAMASGKGKEVVGSIINDLTNYTVIHFQNEERMMTSINFPKIDEHIKCHEEFVNKVSRFKKDYNTGKAVMSMHMMSFLKDWLVGHIQKIDKEYSRVPV